MEGEPYRPSLAPGACRTGWGAFRAGQDGEHRGVADSAHLAFRRAHSSDRELGHKRADERNDLLAVEAALRQWYTKTVLGKTVRTGRPKGGALDGLTPDTFQAIYEKRCRSSEEWRPSVTQYDIAAELNVSTATLRRWLKRHSLSWPPLRQRDSHG